MNPLGPLTRLLSTCYYISLLMAISSAVILIENCKNSVLNFVVLRELYQLTLKLLPSAVAVLKLKSILGVGPKVKDSIEDPFK
jgi:hypothetical protein